MTTIGAALRAATATLGASGIPQPARDARALMARALGVAADRITLVAADPLPAAARSDFDRLVAARGRFQPVAQLTGRRRFWGRDFAVTRDVLDPRPETEVLVARALAGGPAARLLDLGTGSGAILLTLLAEWPGAEGLGTDTSAAALAVAGGNAGRLGLSDRVRFARHDWLDGVAGRFDCIVSNPPYIRADAHPALPRDVRDWEPRAALVSGPTGLECYEAIAPGLISALAPGGRALFEFGAGQGEAVAALFAARGSHVTLHRDLDGRHRVAELLAPGNARAPA